MTNKLPSFDQMVEMAQKDPDALERLRQEQISRLIEQSPEIYQQRLRGLQFQLDAHRRSAKNPMDSCIKASRMMHDSLATLREHLNNQQSPKATNQQDQTLNAEVIPFNQPA